MGRWRLALLLALTVSCDTNSTAPAGGNAGATRTLLTDDPFPFSWVARVDVYVVSVSGSLAPDTSATSGSFVTLATPNRRFNLLALANGTGSELGSVVLPKGAFTAIRMVIDTDSSSITLKDGRVLTATSSPGIHWQSSAGRPTLNALINEQILVPDTGGVVVIDYDVGGAFYPGWTVFPPVTDSSFVFSPVFRAADANRTGSISGVVKNGSGAPVLDASLQLYLGDSTQAEGTWPVVATARTDSTGAFRFAYVTRSAWWKQFPYRASSVYIVSVDPPTGSALSRKLIKGVDVTAKSETSLGTVVLP